MIKIARNFCALTLALLGGCAATSHAPRLAPLPPGAHYVAMGSSFAAGAGIGPTKPNTPARCQRTAINYASLLADRLRLDLSDETCGGATTAHLLGAWGELPPQIDALRPDTRLVTVTIGGNDLGYVGGLIAASCRAGVSFGSRPCPPSTQPTEADYRRVEATLRLFSQQIAARAPKAQLVFVQYVTLVPAFPCAAAPLTPDDAAMSRVIGLRLAEITKSIARRTGALVLPADELSRDHTPCSALPWSKALSSLPNANTGAPWHPNAGGHAAIAGALAGWFELRHGAALQKDVTVDDQPRIANATGPNPRYPGVPRGRTLASKPVGTAAGREEILRIRSHDFH